MSKKVYGVGINDLKGWSNSTNPARRWVYTEWKDMLKRCYSESCHKSQPTYIGCTVCERWLTFSNFVADAPKLPGFDKVIAFGFRGMSLDKDIRVVGNKEYSPDTCKWITIGENTRDSTKRYDYQSVGQKKGRPVVVVSPVGSISEYYGTAEAGRQLGVAQQTVHRCCICKNGSHTLKQGKFKGWSFYWKDEWNRGEHNV